jgi:hypothetical protein
MKFNVSQFWEVTPNPFSLNVKISCDDIKIYCVHLIIALQNSNQVDWVHLLG